ncbi:MAG: DUF1800 family protein, partial [Bacteroidota bacterium]
MKTLLTSQHFYDRLIVGAVVKNPLDYTVGAVRQYGAIMNPTPVNDLYTFYTIAKEASLMQMDLMFPPNVAGWSAYHQQPTFHQNWINTVTIHQRNNFIERLFSEGIESVNGDNVRTRVDPVILATTISDGL